VLVGYARLLTGDAAEAEDLVQEAIVRAWSRRRTGADIEQLDAYVRRTVVNAYLDRTRREIGWRERMRLIGPPPDVPSPEHAAVARTDVEHALDRLSPRERTCVVLRFYEDLTVPEIARRLDLSDGAVKRYLSDALKRLGPLLGSTLHDTDDVAVSTPTAAKGDRR
jgi:RNA polymerase sigma-70 factor (ECF subfamily)